MRLNLLGCAAAVAMLAGISHASADIITVTWTGRASFKSLGDPLFVTGASQGRLLVTMLAAIVEFERKLIRERTGEGRKRAVGNGARFGRKPKLSDFQREEVWRGVVRAKRWQR